MPTDYFQNGSQQISQSIVFDDSRSKAIANMPDGSVRFVTNAGRASASEDLVWAANGTISLNALSIAGNFTVNGILILNTTFTASASAGDVVLKTGASVRFDIGSNPTVVGLSRNGTLGVLLVGDGNSVVALGNATTSAVGAIAGDAILGNGRALRSDNLANTTTIRLIEANTSDRVVIAGGGTDIVWGRALVALGGGAAPTLGTIGGSGPAVAGQNTWMRVIDSTGTAFFVPAWK